MEKLFPIIRVPDEEAAAGADSGVRTGPGPARRLADEIGQIHDPVRVTGRCDIVHVQRTRSRMLV